MTDCASTQTFARVIALTLIGAGEPLLRLEKRLHCAASAVGLTLALEIRKDTEVVDIPYDQTPAILHKEEIILSGLPRTEDLEDWLRATFLAQT